MRLALFALVFVATCVALVTAAPGGGEDPVSAHEERIRRFDLDGDGKLSREEKAAAKAAAGARKDEAGKRTKTGKREKPAKAGRQGKTDRLPGLGKVRAEKARGADLVKRFDADGDGRLSVFEIATMQEDFRRRYGAAK